MAGRKLTESYVQTQKDKHIWRFADNVNSIQTLHRLYSRVFLHPRTCYAWFRVTKSKFFVKWSQSWGLDKAILSFLNSVRGAVIIESCKVKTAGHIRNKPSRRNFFGPPHADSVSIRRENDSFSICNVPAVDCCELQHSFLVAKAQRGTFACKKQHYSTTASCPVLLSDSSIGTWSSSQTTPWMYFKSLCVRFRD